jgi:hypothetical protein
MISSLVSSPQGAQGPSRLATPHLSSRLPVLLSVSPLSSPNIFIPSVFHSSIDSAHNVACPHLSLRSWNAIHDLAPSSGLRAHHENYCVLSARDGRAPLTKRPNEVFRAREIDEPCHAHCSGCTRVQMYKCAHRSIPKRFRWLLNPALLREQGSLVLLPLLHVRHCDTATAYCTDHVARRYQYPAGRGCRRADLAISITQLRKAHHGATAAA